MSPAASATQPIESRFCKQANFIKSVPVLPATGRSRLAPSETVGMDSPTYAQMAAEKLLKHKLFLLALNQASRPKTRWRPAIQRSGHSCRNRASRVQRR
jgi:hypothetical protein